MSNTHAVIGAFFSDGQRVLALPNTQQPRAWFSLALPYRVRWESASMLPGWKLTGKIRKQIYRCCVAAGAGYSFHPPSAPVRISDFCDGVLRECTTAAIIQNPRNNLPKLIARFVDTTGQCVAFCKYGEGKKVCDRLETEFRVLSTLPAGYGPRAMKYGPFYRGTALLLSPLGGRTLSAHAYPGDALCSFLVSLSRNCRNGHSDHPRIRHFARSENPFVRRALAVLATRRWPCVIEHGDCAPWNFIENDTGAISAIDWEYGRGDGLPFFDVAYYIVQVAVLVRHATAHDTAHDAISFLQRTPWPALSAQDAGAFTALAAYEQYWISRDDGHSDSEPAQKLRLEIVREAVS